MGDKTLAGQGLTCEPKLLTSTELKRPSAMHPHAFSVIDSEDHSESELHRARTTLLVKWTQDAQRIRERARGLPERRAATADIPEVRVIKYVEDFRPELQPQVLVDRKLATHS